MAGGGVLLCDPFGHPGGIPHGISLRIPHGISLRLFEAEQARREQVPAGQGVDDQSNVRTAAGTSIQGAQPNSRPECAKPRTGGAKPRVAVFVDSRPRPLVIKISLQHTSENWNGQCLRLPRLSRPAMCHVLLMYTRLQCGGSY